MTSQRQLSSHLLLLLVLASMMRNPAVILDFVLVPRAPEINISSCVVFDNTITVSWQPACDANNIDDISTNGPVEHYELEYRKTNHNNSVTAAGGACWEKIHDIRDTQVTVSGQRNSSKE